MKKKKTHRFLTFLRITLCLVLLLLGLALIFNKSICNFLIGHQSNHYQINKVSKKKIKDNQNVKKVKLSYLDISNNSFTKNSCKHINNILYFSSFISSINISYNSGNFNWTCSNNTICN